jgi:hypothetical protein
MGGKKKVSTQTPFGVTTWWEPVEQPANPATNPEREKEK